MTKLEKLLSTLPPLYSTENETAETLIMPIRLYIVNSVPEMCWYPTEFCPETGTIFGGAFLFHDVGIELGYSSLQEYECLTKDYGARIDKTYQPKTFAEVKKSLEELV